MQLLHRSEASPVFFFDRCSICSIEGAISRTNCGKRTKRKANQVRQGNIEVVERCLLQLSAIVLNITAMDVFLAFNEAARWCNLFEGQDGRDGFRVSENPVICEKHLRKHEISKVSGE